MNPVLPGEDANQWEVFRTGVAADLGAVGTLETEADILDRVFAEKRIGGTEAMFLLRAAITFLPSETNDATGCESDEEPSLTVVNEADFLTGLGVPERHLDDPEGWDGWSAATVRKGFGQLARTAGWTLERFLTSARRFAADDVAGAARAVSEWREKLAVAVKLAADAEARHRRTVAIPTGPNLEAVLRYELHLSRQLAGAMDVLERAKANRRSG